VVTYASRTTNQTPPAGAAGDATVPKATAAETFSLIAGAAGPVLAKGPIIRRPKVMAVAGHLDLTRGAVRLMQRLRNKYGTGPVLVEIPGRRYAVILAPEHVRRVLDETPEPFATATKEKRAALSHFEPKQALISHGPERADRRRYNEAVLDSERPVHRLAERFLAVVDEEAGGLLSEVRREGELTWNRFLEAWFRMVRRVTLGEAARDDRELTDMLARLRYTADWLVLAPPRRDLQEQFYTRLSSHIARAEPGSLASVMAATPVTGVTAPAHQVSQWLFAFDPAGMATFRTLALLTSHPTQAQRARDEIKARTGLARQDLPYLRACILDCLRLWPTTPAVLRETTRETVWETGTMPAQTGIVIFAPFFHRDDQRLPFADRFAPEVWLGETPPMSWPLIPFSSGPAVCPGRNLMLLIGSAMLAALLDGREVRVTSPVRLDPDRPLPAEELNNYALRFALRG
jgi:cytochrome P450